MDWVLCPVCWLTESLLYLKKTRFGTCISAFGQYLDPITLCLGQIKKEVK